MERMLDQHGSCQFEIFIFHVVYNDSGAIGRGHDGFEANPETDVNRVGGGVGEGSLPRDY